MTMVHEVYNIRKSKMCDSSIKVRMGVREVNYWEVLTREFLYYHFKGKHIKLKDIFHKCKGITKINQSHGYDVNFMCQFGYRIGHGTQALIFGQTFFLMFLEGCLWINI